MNILPQPNELIIQEGTFSLSRNTVIIFDEKFGIRKSILPLQQLADEIETLFKFRPTITRGGRQENYSIFCSFDVTLNKEAYKVKVDNKKIEITAGKEAGMYYGIQTLMQIFRTEGCEISCMKISDTPDFVNRGFYHDAARGKVSTLETYYKLVDKLASYKINQLQLYVEHTFAFSKHTDIWSCSDPLTHEEILSLDAYCLQRHVELVPSLSTFGHFYMVLRSKRKEHLNELDIKASEKEFTYPDRQHHYTLDCQNPESIELINELVSEFSPLFSSNIFNICCDETFDLGKGKNKDLAKERGESRLYMDFLLQVIASVHKHGKQPMMWGDIIVKHPEYIDEIPKDVIVLNWEYAESLIWREAVGDAVVLSDSKVFAEAGLEFYNCPGVSCWNRNSSRINGIDRNIQMMAEEAKKHGGTGVLNTDWGDYGHFNVLSSSYYGLALGASASWNCNAAKDIAGFEKSFSLLELGDNTLKIASLLRSLGDCELFDWADLVRWGSTPINEGDLISKAIDGKTGMTKRSIAIEPEKLHLAYIKAKSIELKIRNIAAKSKAQDNLSYRELLFSAWGVALFQSVGLGWKRSLGNKVPSDVPSNYEIADELRHFEVELSKLWHIRNKPSEYYRIKEHLNKAAMKLDTL